MRDRNSLGEAGLRMHAAQKSTARTVLGSTLPPVKNYPNRVVLPPDLREQMLKTISYTIDFLLDTLDFSPDEPQVPLNETEAGVQLSGDPMSKDHYCIIVWNDDKHSFDEVAQLLVDLTPTRTREEADAIARLIDDAGRAMVASGGHLTRLLEIAHTIAQIDLGVTVRRAYDTFREHMCAVVIEWLLDLTRSRLGTDALILRELITIALMSPRRRDPGLSSTTARVQAAMVGVKEPHRLDWLFLYHTKLWKKPRLSLKEIYASILTLSHEHKLAVGALIDCIMDQTNAYCTHKPVTSPMCIHGLSTHICSPTGKPKPPSNTLRCNFSQLRL